MGKFKILILTLLFSYFSIAHSKVQEEPRVIMKIKATDKFERSELANMDLTIERIEEDYVMAIGPLEIQKQLEREGRLILKFPFQPEGFPKEDSNFNDYDEMNQKIQIWQNTFQDILSVEQIGQSLQGRKIYNLRISTDLDRSHEKPAIVFMGGHHAREHVSVEMALKVVEFLLEGYKSNDSRIVSLVKSREIHIIPLVNPDGTEFDISDNKYHMWRKNRKGNKDGSFGVDLNRNYGYQWGTGGSSSKPSSDIYMGPEPFSEPETRVIKQFIEAHENITILVTFHTFSKLILYPWGHKYAPIDVERDYLVHKTMAETMAKWNGYTPQQASDLYVASGDTTDWAYGAHRIISFTFELDPQNFNQGGFYPGQGILPQVYSKNREPCLYLISYADNPYRVLEPNHFQFGLSSPVW